MTLLWGGALIVPAGIAWLWIRRGESAVRLVLAFAALLTFAGLFIDPSDNNQSKFLNLLFLLLAAPAGQGWIDLARRLGRVRRLGHLARPAVILFWGLAVAPTAVLSFWAYACDPGRRGDPGGEAAPSEREALTWARSHTPPDAVFVEAGARRDAAVLAVRSVLWGGEAWAKKWGYPPEALEMRRRAAAELLSGGEISEDVAAFLSGLGRPIILVEGTAGEMAAPPGNGPPRRGVPISGDRIYDKEGMSLIQVRRVR